MVVYVKLEKVMHIIDLVITDDSIKHKGKAVRKRLKELPAEDVEKVVRCKDCEHFKPQNQSAHWSATKCYCMRTAAVKVNENDFCSHGVKKEGAEE